MPEAPPLGFSLASTAFAPGAAIPWKHTCDGGDVSPALSWSGTPPETKALVLILDDPDARGFAHWVLYDLPPTTRALPEGLATSNTLKEFGGARQGTNGFRRIGYGGPCPPSGKPHHYHFKLYALDAPTDLPALATKPDVEGAMQRHILGVARLMGTYERRR